MGNYGDGLVKEIDPRVLKAFLAEGGVPIVAGFQGVRFDNRLMTLGRGGSDITAAALAQSLGADGCQIFTDVEGVFTADPNLVETAQRFQYISLDFMRRLALKGAQVLHPRTLDFIETSGISLEVLSSQTRAPGTRVAKNIASSFDVGIAVTDGWSFWGELSEEACQSLSHALPVAQNYLFHSGEKGAQLYLPKRLSDLHQEKLAFLLSHQAKKVDLSCISVVCSTEKNKVSGVMPRLHTQGRWRPLSAVTAPGSDLSFFVHCSQKASVTGALHTLLIG
jgi:aspartokinase